MNEAFKFYKNKTKEPDLSRVVDCSEKDDGKVRGRSRNLEKSPRNSLNF
jgi:hypothetical protein